MVSHGWTRVGRAPSILSFLGMRALPIHWSLSTHCREATRVPGHGLGDKKMSIVCLSLTECEGSNTRYLFVKLL